MGLGLKLNAGKNKHNQRRQGNVFNPQNNQSNLPILPLLQNLQTVPQALQPLMQGLKPLQPQPKKGKKGNIPPKRLKGKNRLIVRFKGLFHTNILRFILDFVRNDREIELYFDPSLSPQERKNVHHLVERISLCEDPSELQFDDEEQMQIAEEIITCNKYILCTQSDGKNKKRQLCLFKEASPHTFLITPHDLREEFNETNKSVKVETQKKGTNVVQNNAVTKAPTEAVNSLNIEVDNPESKMENKNNDEVTEKVSDKKSEAKISNVTKGDESGNVKKVKENIGKKEGNASNAKDKDTDIVGLLIDYLIEFVEDKKYTELRFLGPFNVQELEGIDDFYNVINDGKDHEKKNLLLEAFTNEEYYYDVVVDNNGSNVIYKISKDQETDT